MFLGLQSNDPSLLFQVPSASGLCDTLTHLHTDKKPDCVLFEWFLCFVLPVMLRQRQTEHGLLA